MVAAAVQLERTKIRLCVLPRSETNKFRSRENVVQVGDIFRMHKMETSRPGWESQGFLSYAARNVDVLLISHIWTSVDRIYWLPCVVISDACQPNLRAITA